MRAAPAVLVGSFLMPPEGLGFSLCAFKALTHLPCPACGLGRSLACLSHLSWGESIRLHPFGPLIYAMLLALGCASALGEERRQRVRAWLDRHRDGARLVYHGFIWAFVAFGVARLGLKLVFPSWFMNV